MRLFEEIKHRVEEISIEDKRLFERQKENDLDKLFKMVKEELVDFSFMVKESENKIEGLFKKSRSVQSGTHNQFNFIGTPTNQSNNVFVNRSKDGYDYKDVVNDLRRKNDELVNEMMELKEKFMDSRIKNIDLKNKLKVNIALDKKELHSTYKSTGEKMFSKTEFRKSRPTNFVDQEVVERREVIETFISEAK
jgi:hypothetical protein